MHRRLGHPWLIMPRRPFSISLPNSPILNTTFKVSNMQRPALANISKTDTYDFQTVLKSLLPVQDELLTHGVKAEDRVAILTGKKFEYVSALYGTYSAKAVALPLHHSYPNEELEYLIKDSGSKIILHSEDLSNKAHELKEKLGLESILIKSFEPEESMSSQSDEVKIAWDKEAQNSKTLMIYTSGTTGRPKGCVHTLKSLESQISGLKKVWRCSERDRLLHVLPVHHIHGIVNALMLPLYCGGTIELMPTFDAQEVWDRLEEEDKVKISLFMAVPTIYSKLLDKIPKRDNVDAALSRMRLMISGSAALPANVRERWYRDTGYVLLERYGSTEAGMVLSHTYSSRTAGSVGFPLPDNQVRIIQDNGKSVQSSDTNSQGELQVKSPSLFSEYWNKPSATKDAFSTDGWFKTGDVGQYNDDASISIKGRESVDIIKSGGFKIGALEIEREILTLSGVKEVAVFGVDDEQYDQNVAAVISMKEGASMDKRKLYKSLKDKLANYKIPQLLKVVDEIEKNAMGKINKKQLRLLF